MKPQVSMITVVLLAANLSTLTFGAEERQEPAAGNNDPDQYQSYLDAVRAQRQSRRQERAKAIREAAENRRRVMDPWGESRRQEMEYRAQRHQENPIDYRRWSNPESEHIKELQEQQHKARKAQVEVQREQYRELEPWLPPPKPTPPHWDNPWYYQGY